MYNDALKKFTQEAKDAFVAGVNAKEVQDAISAIKDDGQDNGTFRTIMSTEMVDRQGEIVKADGWDFTHFMKNPVVLWAHNYSALPIGIITNIYKEGNQIIGEGKFASAEANPFAQQVRKLYDMGIVRAVSVGFISTEYDRAKATSVKQELLELSFVPVPANAEAIRLNSYVLNTLGIDKTMLAMKGIAIKTDDEPVVEEVATTEVVNTETVVEETQAAETTETTTEVVEAEKGAIADELSEDEMNEQKYSKLDEFFEVIWAFVDVYMDPETPVENFDTLIAELVTLLQTPTTYDDDTKSIIGKSVVSNRKSGKVKAGRAISAQNRDKLKSVLAEMEKCIETHKGTMDSQVSVCTALTELLKSDSPDGSADTGAEVEKTLADGPKPLTSGIPETREKLEELHTGRTILVLAKDVIENGIANFNVKITETEKVRRAKRNGVN